MSTRPVWQKTKAISLLMQNKCSTVMVQAVKCKNCVRFTLDFNFRSFVENQSRPGSRPREESETQRERTSERNFEANYWAKLFWVICHKTSSSRERGRFFRDFPHFVCNSFLPRSNSLPAQTFTFVRIIDVNCRPPKKWLIGLICCVNHADASRFEQLDDDKWALQVQYFIDTVSYE